MKGKRKINIGTSGWNYPHWQGIFYPPGLPKSRWLKFYSRHFDTLEINATFYGRPKPATFKRWYETTPSPFLFSVKASRYITHIKRLKGIEEPLQRLYKDLSFLKEKRGALLFQLPPNFAYSEERIDTFIQLLDPSIPTALEIRHQSFLNPGFFQLLRKHNVAFCISDTAGRYPSLSYELTADFTYIRLHGSQILYASPYTPEELEAWAERINTWGIQAYVYFDNDAYGYAVTNALQLKKILTEIIQN